MSIEAVISGSKRWHCDCADVLTWLARLPDDSIDLLFTSPPYEAARTYGIGFAVKGQAWVDWMHEVVKAAAPKVKGLIAIVCEGQTRDFRYSAAPFLRQDAGECLHGSISTDVMDDRPWPATGSSGRRAWPTSARW